MHVALAFSICAMQMDLKAQSMCCTVALQRAGEAQVVQELEKFVRILCGKALERLLVCLSTEKSHR